MTPEPLIHVSAMAPYALADLNAACGKTTMQLAQNESLRPPSPTVADAVTRVVRNTQLYPDPDWTELREALATMHGLDVNRLICGNGSLDLISGIARAYLGPGDAALAPEHAYPFFRTATWMTGARFDIAAETNRTANIEALLDAIKPDTKVVFVANPGNPTGTRVSLDEIEQLRRDMPSSVLLVLDEAYGEFADHLDRRAWHLVELGNTVVLRTFSKAYGLAGLRVGWGCFPETVLGQVRKVMNPNNVTILSQVAAHAALNDQAYMKETCAITENIRTRFIEKISALGMSVQDSATNFVLLVCRDQKMANGVETHLARDGIFVRPQGGAGLPQCLRVTVGAENEMTFVADRMAHSLEVAK